MDVRVGLLFLVFMLGVCHARNLLTSDHPSSTLVLDNDQVQIENPDEDSEDLQQVVCTLCERFTAQALDYLSDNKTQTDVMGLLHNTCSQMWTMKQKCLIMVDYYGPLFFSEVTTIKPATFCQDVDLCSRTSATSPPLLQRSCDFCHRALAQAALTLKDPNRQAALMDSLLKGCDAVVGGYVEKCKKMVSEYGPLILINAELYLETADICNTLHACHVPTTTTHQDGLLLSKLLN